MTTISIDGLYVVPLLDLYSRLGLLEGMRVTDVLDAAYRQENDREWRSRFRQSPHGQAWHLSFHASRFPGDDPKACARKAMYDFMAVPEMKPFTPWSRTIMDAGKDAEERFVWRLYNYGVLVSAPPSADVQTGYSDDEVWLTVSSDAVVKLPGTHKPHCLEIKGKDRNSIDEMRAGFRTYEPSHYRQLCCQIVLANRYSPVLWPDLDPVDSGELLYFARDVPAHRHSYYITLDEALRVYNAGREKLLQWKEMFKSDRLPARDPSWMWTNPDITPCHWCGVKPLCKADLKAKTTKISESVALLHAKEVYGDDYDPVHVRQAVLDRWKDSR